MFCKDNLFNSKIIGNGLKSRHWIFEAVIVYQIISIIFYLFIKEICTGLFELRKKAIFAAALANGGVAQLVRAHDS